MPELDSSPIELDIPHPTGKIFPVYDPELIALDQLLSVCPEKSTMASKKAPEAIDGWKDIISNTRLTREEIARCISTTSPPSLVQKMVTAFQCNRKKMVNQGHDPDLLNYANTDYDRGRILLFRGKWAKAEKIFQREVETGNTLALLSLAASQMAQGKLKVAAENFQGAIDAGFPRGHIGLQFLQLSHLPLFHKRKVFEQAIAGLEQAIQFPLSALTGKKMEESMTTGADEGDEDNKYISRPYSDKAFHTRSPEPVTGDLQKIIPVYPYDGEVFYFLGRLYHELGNLDKAQQYFRLAGEAGLAAGWNDLGAICTDNEDEKSASYCKTMAYQYRWNHPLSVQPIRTIKIVFPTEIVLDAYASEGEVNHANEKLAESTLINATIILIHQLITIILFSLAKVYSGRGNKKKTLSVLKLSTRFGSPASWTTLGDTHAVYDDPDEATAAYSKAEQMGYAPASVRMGDLYYFDQNGGPARTDYSDYPFTNTVPDDCPFNHERIERRREALPYYQKAAMQGNRQALRRLGNMRAADEDQWYAEDNETKYRNFREAIRWYESIGRKSGDDLNNLGCLWYVVGDEEKATRFFERAAQKGSKAASCNLAFFLDEKGGTPQEVEKLFLQVASAKYPWGYYFLGKFYFESKDYKKALKYFFLAEKAGISTFPAGGFFIGNNSLNLEYYLKEIHEEIGEGEQSIEAETLAKENDAMIDKYRAHSLATDADKPSRRTPSKKAKGHDPSEPSSGI